MNVRAVNSLKLSLFLITVCPFSVTHAQELVGDEGLPEQERIRDVKDQMARFPKDFGQVVVSDEKAVIWWAGPNYNVFRDTDAPHGRAEAVTVSAAGNEYEPFQLVVTANSDMRQVWVEPTDFVGPSGTVIPKENLQIMEVGYVPVTSSIVYAEPGDYPDPLPLLEAPIDLVAGENQPFWITVYVPENTPAGIYKGEVSVASESWQARIPVEVKVHPFSLPKETHLATPFGLYSAAVKEYHNPRSEEEMTQIMERYYDNFARHRVSPYDHRAPYYAAPIVVDWGAAGGALWSGGEVSGEDPYQGDASLHLKAGSLTAGSKSSYLRPIQADTDASYQIAFAVRGAEEGQAYEVRVARRAEGQWDFGAEDMVMQRTVGEDWTEVSLDVPGLDDRTKFLELSIRLPEGGQAWFDDIQLTAGKENLLAGSDFEGEVTPGQVTIDFSRFNPEMEQKVEDYAFSVWKFKIEGMGGGRSANRRLPRIGPYTAPSEEYDALFSSYLKQLESHLVEKGWVDNSFIYWYDEPEPDDYEFFNETNQRIEKFAPRLNRMLTEQPEPEIMGSVDIWCPITTTFRERDVIEQKEAGNQYWWYICTAPRMNYATLFIDKPALEIRTWLWQTWMHDVEGILMWTTNAWTNSGNPKYKEKRQNPWEDPMTYSRAGEWGNGDGRFIYPPNRDPNGEAVTYLEGPVDSIRWENLREGIEDYEYFHLLETLISEAKQAGVAGSDLAEFENLLEVPASVTTGLKEFSTDPRPMMVHRAKMAAAIEAVQAILAENH